MRVLHDLTTFAGAATAAFTVACAGGDIAPASEGQNVVDAPTLALVEELRAGDSENADAQFAGVFGLASASAERLLLLDGASSAVIVFDSTGTVLARFGRRGQGPGEFQGARFIGVRNDTVMIVDRGGFHQFTIDGALLESRRFSRTPPGMIGLYSAADKWFMVHTVSITEFEKGIGYRDTLVARELVTVDGSLGPPVVSLPDRQDFALGEAGWVLSTFMEAVPRIAVSPTGRIFATSGKDYVLHVHGPGGDTLQTIAGEVEHLRVTQADFDAYLQNEIDTYSGFAAASSSQNNESAMVVEMLRSEGKVPGFSPTRPILGRIIVASDDSFIVERLDLDPDPATASDSTMWDYFDGAGRIQGRIVLGPIDVPRMLHHNRVFVATRDTNEVPIVVRYRITLPDEQGK